MGRTNGVYDRMEFPTYQYREYPKWVKRANGTEVACASLAEELKVLAEPVESPAVAQTQDELDKTSLLAIIAKQQADMEELKKQLLDRDVPQMGEAPKLGDPIPTPTAPVGVAAAPAKPVPVPPTPAVAPAPAAPPAPSTIKLKV